MKNYILLVVLILLSAISCKNNTKETSKIKDGESQAAIIESTIEQDTETIKLKVILESKGEKKSKAVAYFAQKGEIVTLDFKTKGLTPGLHAIHIHEKADCASPDGKSAGGHWNPTFENHGQWGSEKGYHKGDIGNFAVDNNGVGAISMSTDQWCIGCDDPAKNILGKAVIVHQGEDDLTSQPSGAAGARVSCGGIIE
ncbi:superoxide dismutase family protein [Flavobacteriaceae bacterium]|nr:superoxide dismutase family protein [Flavobacteriaceae bacterium]